MAAASGGIGGVLVLGALLYFTGAGQWIYKRMERLDGNCMAMADVLTPRVATPLCGGIDRGMKAVRNAKGWVSDEIGKLRGWWMRHFSKAGELFDGSQGLTAPLADALQGLGSSGEQLRQLMRAGPAALSVGENPTKNLQHALDSFRIGQYYVGVRQNATQALPWLQTSAMQPQGFGVISQMYLGDLYRIGGAGLRPDPVQSHAYYQQALISLQELQRAGTPQAQQLLGQMGVSPQALQAQILQAVQQIKAGQAR